MTDSSSTNLDGDGRDTTSRQGPPLPVQPTVHDTSHTFACTGYCPPASPSVAHWLIPGGVFACCAALFVGADVIEHHLFPDMTIGWRHGLLTARAAVVSLAGCATVYLLMRRHQARLSRTAHELTRLLASYQPNSGATGRFVNRHRVHCRQVLKCRRSECPVYDEPDEVCWHVIALAGASRGPGAPPITIDQCHRCAVYRRACPEELSQLGESFNNLMFLLDEESRQVGRMRAQLVEKEKMVAIGQMAAGIAHEVGNPLSSISSIVQMLKRKKAAAANGQLDLIQQHIQRISGTVRQLVGLARPAPDRWEPADVAEIVVDALRLIRFDRRSRQVEVKLDRAPHVPTTYALRGQLQQVFLNLLLNALDAMPDGGRLRVRVRADRFDIVITVTDSGYGISPSCGRRIFEPFFTTKEPGRGTGLGLAVSYGIVQKHGGTIDFTSTEGEGTSFSVRIPIVDRPPDPCDDLKDRTACG